MALVITHTESVESLLQARVLRKYRFTNKLGLPCRRDTLLAVRASQFRMFSGEQRKILFPSYVSW